MVAEKTKRTPKGVGKRIIETLKSKEADFEIDEQPISETIEPVEEEFEYEPVEEEVIEKYQASQGPVSDIDTLLNLISHLPSGVTKQTGALIIRQTMEAMGISMNNVLANAQSVQEGLENSIRNNVNVIEEYRTKIKILEQEIQKFRKKAHELEDIISLFILSEDKK